MAGQSNMAGQGITASLDDPHTPKNVLFLNQSISPKFGMMDKPVYMDFTQRAVFGPEVGLSHKLSCQLYIVKLAKDGTGIDEWKPGGVLYNTLIKMTRNMLTKINPPPDKRFFLWVQGEHDAKFRELAYGYHNKLEELFSSLDKDIGNLHFVIAETDARKYKEIVVDAQRQLAEERNDTVTIPTKGLSKYPGNVHYDAKGQLMLGERFGKKMGETTSCLIP